VSLNTQPLGELLDAIAAKVPTPGGGAVASITASLAAALARMVVNYSIGRRSLARYEALHARALNRLTERGHRALELADADARAYARLNQLWKLPEDDPERTAEWSAAVSAAIAAPQEVLELAVDMLRLFEELVETSNRMLRSDLAIAAVLAEAAARAAAWNVRINLPQLGNPEEGRLREESTATLLTEIRSLCERVEQGCQDAPATEP